MTAVFQKSDKAINLLVNKCNLNICDNNGNTAFIIAAANGDLLTLKLILRKDPQFQYVKNFDGQNALHRACYFGELETVSFLLR
jgi:ankyrin repeat protein